MAVRDTRCTAYSMEAVASCVTGLHRRRCQESHAGAQKALLLNALGSEGDNTYLRAAEDEQQPGSDRPTKETVLSVYDAALALLNELFDPQPDAACLRTHFKALHQGPNQSVVKFIQEVRRVQKLCEFGTVGDILAFDQLVSGIASPYLQRIFFKMGKDFSLQMALDVAREEKCKPAPCCRFQFKMAAQLSELFKLPGQMVAVLPKLHRKMAPAGLLLRAPPCLLLLRTHPLQLRCRLARVPVIATAR
ncbi:hypothetical protein HPB51_012909 [Rhipicephalus microplus]|uniref:Tick transposon n=1 Tax=Rhipicephalus microplus TaxID=6941 RepID=A0A9J6EHG7_RHIMP|nr:hypothetical protein HPB51_012909 [Rhipicephalus microplus]